MRHLSALAFLALSALAVPVGAQSFGNGGYTFSADLGAGVKYSPDYLGADDKEASPWLIMRNGSLLRSGEDGEETTDGFWVVPSFRYIGRRDADDHDNLTGMDDVKAAGEVGFRLKYDQGQTSSYVAVRRGFGGHEGFAGEFGAKYRIDASDRLTFWTGAEARFGSDKFTRAYFGVTPEEALTSNHAAFDPDSGIYAAAIAVEARYALTENMALMGELEYTRLIGDAADSPLVESKDQPSVSLGLVRRFNFRF